jgi:hypothetical protein
MRQKNFAGTRRRWVLTSGDMSFLPFLRGLVFTLAAFAICTYLTSGSVWTTLALTFICGVLIQVGYFVAIIFMTWRSPGKHESSTEKDKIDSKQTADLRVTRFARKFGRGPSV